MMQVKNYGEFLYTPNTKIVVTHGNNRTMLFDDAYDYEKDSMLYGCSLIDILLSESEIKLNSQTNEIILSRIFTSNAHSDATRLIGSIAEVLVTRFCKEYPELNRRLGMCGRNDSDGRSSKIMDNYIAIATGSQQTKKTYPIYYNPNDTQRDIIWVDKKNTQHQLLCIKSTLYHGKPAGIQVKTSHNYQYVLNNIKQYHYPILYFDLSNDWYKLYQALNKSDFVSRLILHDDITHEIKRILIAYFNLLIPIFNNEKTLQYLVEMSKYEGYSDILKGLELANSDSHNKIIIPA